MKTFRVFTLVVASLYLSISSASAGSIVLGETKALSPPAAATQASIEFYLDRTGADDGTPLSVGNFQVRVALTGIGAGSTVRILGAGPTTARPQAFALDTTNVTGGIGAFAATLNLTSPFDIEDGAGLMKLDLELLPGANGNYLLTVQAGGGNTEFTSPVDFATLLAVDVGSGSLNVVPEPNSAILLLGAAAAVAVARRRAVALSHM
jgi:hypothetical protein